MSTLSRIIEATELTDELLLDVLKNAKSDNGHKLNPTPEMIASYLRQHRDLYLKPKNVSAKLKALAKKGLVKNVGDRKGSWWKLVSEMIV